MEIKAMYNKNRRKFSISVLKRISIRYYSFPGSSAGKESACNAGDPGSIPRLRSSPGEGINYPLHFWASLVAQMVKSPPANA